MCLFVPGAHIHAVYSMCSRLCRALATLTHAASTDHCPSRRCRHADAQIDLAFDPSPAVASLSALLVQLARLPMQQDQRKIQPRQDRVDQRRWNGAAALGAGAVAAVAAATAMPRDRPSCKRPGEGALPISQSLTQSHWREMSAAHFSKHACSSRKQEACGPPQGEWPRCETSAASVRAAQQAKSAQSCLASCKSRASGPPRWDNGRETYI